MYYQVPSPPSLPFHQAHHCCPQALNFNNGAIYKIQ
jgi:hypothetical protein